MFYEYQDVPVEPTNKVASEDEAVEDYYYEYEEYESEGPSQVQSSGNPSHRQRKVDIVLAEMR